MTSNPDLDEALTALTAARPVVVRTTTAERVADVLREQVVEGRLRSGARLPEETVAGALRVSRNTVREALSQLVVERVLVREANRGVFVATPTADDVRDVYAARRVIEPGAVEHGDAFDSSTVAAVRAAVEEGRAAAAADDWDGVASANQHFHRALVAIAGSPRLDHQMALLLAEMRLVFHRMPTTRAFHEPYLEQNAMICERLDARDRTGAAAALRRYLGQAQGQLLEAYAKL